MSSKEAQEQFMVELTELTKKYGVAIAGCGCCGSPYLITEKHSKGIPIPVKHGSYEYHKDYFENIEWVEKNDARR